jgi:hypothetical protein
VEVVREGTRPIGVRVSGCAVRMMTGSLEL